MFNNIIKHISFKDTQYEYYDHSIIVYDEEDSKFLDQAQTTSMIFHNIDKHNNNYWVDGRPMIKYPGFHKGKKYKLPINEYFIKQYNNIKIHLHSTTIENSIGGEGRKIEILEPTNSDFNLNKIYPLLNFEGKSWQHFTQDCLPILIFGLDLLKTNPDIDLLVYEPHTWSKDTFFELMKHFNLDNKVIFIPYGVDYQINIKTLYNFETESTIPTWWWNNWFYEEANKYFNTSKENTNVILIERPHSRAIQNINEIENLLKEYANLNNLDFYRIDPSNLKPQDLFSIFNKAHTIISPHGGANYNILFCNSNVKFIELCFTNCMYTLYNIASSIKCKYYIIPNDGHNNTQNFYVDINKIKQIINE